MKKIFWSCVLWCTLNSSVFLSRNYRLIVALPKFDVLETNMLVLKNITFPKGNYQTDSSET